MAANGAGTDNGEFGCYGVSANPYDLGELDPLSQSTHTHFFVPSPSFANLDPVDRVIDKAIGQKRCAVFVVEGKKGSGRSSITNYILSRYRERRGIKPERFLIPDADPHNDAFEFLMEWIEALRTELDDPPLLETVDQILNEAETATSVNYRPRFNRVLRRVSRGLSDLQEPDSEGNEAAAPAAFALRLRDPLDHEFAMSVVLACERANAICVIEALDHEYLGQGLSQVILGLQRVTAKDAVPLQRLNADCVLDIAERFWVFAGATPPHPFSEKGIRWAYADALPADPVLNELQYLMRMNLPTTGKGKWPKNKSKLELTEKKIRHWLKERRNKQPES